MARRTLSRAKEKENTTVISKTALTPPIADQKDSVIVTHGHTRIDPYFWMRLTDEQKNAKTPDAQTQKVLDYLNTNVVNP